MTGPTLTEILAAVMITIAILCMIIVLLLLWCLKRRRKRRQETSREEEFGNVNPGFPRPVTEQHHRTPELPSIPELNENNIPQNFPDAPRPSYLTPIQIPTPPASSQYGSRASSQYGSGAGSQYGSEGSEPLSIADTTLFIKAAVDSYLELLKSHYNFQEGQAPILPALPHDFRPPSGSTADPPVLLPKYPKRKSLRRKNTVNMNTYINGYDSTKWEIPRDEITIDDIPIGSGYFGDVYKAKLQRVNGENSKTVVVKTLKKDSSNREKGQFLKELATHALIEPHDHIVRLIGSCTKSTPFLMILEYAEKGSLSDFLNQQAFDKERGHRNVVNFGHQIADGMAYLSEMKIVHRDLAARNILVTADEICKVSDFGFARDIFGLKTCNKRMSLEPVRWMAPESIKNNVFSTKSDIWAFGIVLWEITTFARLKPFSDIDSHLLRQQVIEGDHVSLNKPKDCPSDLFHIMKWCWSINPDDRPSFHLLSDFLDDKREQYLEASEMAFGTMPDIIRPRQESYVDDAEMNALEISRRMSTDL